MVLYLKATRFTRTSLGGDIIKSYFYRNESSVSSFKYSFLELCKVVM